MSNWIVVALAVTMVGTCFVFAYKMWRYKPKVISPWPFIAMELALAAFAATLAMSYLERALP